MTTVKMFGALTGELRMPGCEHSIRVPMSDPASLTRKTSYHCKFIGRQHSVSTGDLGRLWWLGNRKEVTRMTTLDDLIKIDGVVAAGEFTADGKLVDYKANMDMSREMAATSAQFCATITMMFNTLAGAFSQLSQMNWVPQQGWAYSGGDMTVAIGGNKGVFIKTAKTDFNQLFQVLVGK